MYVYVLPIFVFEHQIDVFDFTDFVRNKTTANVQII